VPARHGRQAALPPSGFTRPPSLSADGLHITVYEEDGTVAGICDFERLVKSGPMPGSLELRKAFAAAFDRKAGPDRAWRSFSTCRNARKSVVAFLTFISRQPQAPQAPAEITPALWNAWRLQLPAAEIGRAHLRYLRTLMPLVEGIPPETLKAADRRVSSTPRTGTPSSYPYTQYEQIKATAAAIFNSGLVRIRTNREHLRRWYAGQFTDGSADWLLGEVLNHILTTGDAGLADVKGRALIGRHRRVLGGHEPEVSWGRLYLTRQEASAASVLLVASEAWNASTLERMDIPDHDPAVGESDFDIHTVHLDKRRRSVRLRHTTNNLLDIGPDSPGRLMGQVIEATELARETLGLLGRPTRRLLVWRRAHPGRGDVFAIGLPHGTDRNPGEHAPSNVSLKRLRRTTQVLVRKEPAQNTEATHEDVYLLGDPQTRDEVQDTVAQGLTDAVEHARAIVKMRVVLGDDAEQLLELSDDPVLARAIAAGEYDTATAACTDMTHSPYTEPGLPCTASFLLCLGCGNAVATRRHLPCLAYLHQTLDDLRAVLTAAVWEHDWSEHFLRLDSIRTTRVTGPEWAAAAAATTPADRELIDRMLARRLEAR
jgi:hypothetical protein